MKKIISYSLVAIQFLCIAILAFSSKIQGSTSVSLLLIILGVILGIWSVIIMKLKNLHITPDVHNKAILVENGPYKIIRHPMYLAVLMLCLGMLLEKFTTENFIIYLILLIDLLIKLLYEEGLLLKHFADYKNYQQKTYRLLPFLF